jgi:hypothetical protein
METAPIGRFFHAQVGVADCEAAVIVDSTRAAGSDGPISLRHQRLITNLKWVQIIFQFRNLSAPLWLSQQRLLIEYKRCNANSQRPPRWAASFLSSRFRRLFPVPFAGLRVVVGGTAFNHLVAEFGARHDERGEIATAKAECAEGKNDDKFQQRLTHCSVVLRQYPKP